MLRNYFLVAWRNLAKHRLNAGVNLLGLSVAFMCSILLFLMVHREFSVDRFHRNGASLYEVYGLAQAPEKLEKRNSMSYPMAPTLKAEVPAIIRTTGFMQSDNGIRYGNKEVAKQVVLVDNDFFSMFSFPVVKGATANALEGLGDVVISQSTATAVFGKADPVGKMVKVKVNGNWKDVTVTSVLQDPRKVHRFSLIFSPGWS